MNGDDDNPFMLDESSMSNIFQTYAQHQENQRQQLEKLQSERAPIPTDPFENYKSRFAKSDDPSIQAQCDDNNPFIETPSQNDIFNTEDDGITFFIPINADNTKQFIVPIPDNDTGEITFVAMDIENNNDEDPDGAGAENVGTQAVQPLHCVGYDYDDPFGYSEFDIDPSISDSFHRSGGPKINFDICDWEDLPELALRHSMKLVDPSKDDFLFQLSDVTVGKDESGPGGKECIMFLHGNSPDGSTVCGKYRGYKPFMFLSMPELESREAEQKWADDFMAGLRKNSTELPFDEMYRYTVEYKLPAVGFRNRKTMPFLLLELWTMSAYYRFREHINAMFPPPTKEQVDSGEYKEINKVMLCDAYSKEEMKFCDWADINLCGWVRLHKKMYAFKSDISYAQYSFSTGHVSGAPEKENIAPALVDSFDIESIRDDGAEAMPEATQPNDCIASIGHAMQPTDKSAAPYYIAFTWGGDVVLPTHDRKTGKPLPQRKIIIKNYDTEAQMLTAWVRWRRSQGVSPDITIGWNIYGFDLGYIATRIRVLRATTGMPQDVNEWGRLIGYETKIKESKIQSKAIAFNQYKLTPSPGNVFIDSLILYQRDVTLRLHDYRLETVGKSLLNEGKTDVHYSEIKNLFYGTPEERGLLIWYNIQDCDLVLRLWHKSGHYPKVINISRVNRVLLNLLCPRGQQIRVFGGFHYVAWKNNYVVYRPHYHPILDNPIIEEDEVEADRIRKRIERKGEAGIEDLKEYWINAMILGKVKPTISMVNTDENGGQTSRVIWENGVSVHDSNLQESVKDDEDIFEVTPSSVSANDNNNNQHINSKKRTHNQIFTKGSGVVTYIPDKKKAPIATTSNGNTRNSSPTAKKVFVFGNGKTTAQIGKTMASRRPKKLIKGRDGKMHEAAYTSKNARRNDDKEESETAAQKGFSGGFVMEPVKGYFRNVPILDFNALYPSIMMSYCLDPALLVLDEKFSNCPGVKYLDIQFSDTCVFRFAQGLPGVMIQHTQNLVSSRKIAQGVMGAANAKVNYTRQLLCDILQTTSEKFDDVVEDSVAFCEKFGESATKNDVLTLHCYERMLDGEKATLSKTFQDYVKANDNDEASDDVRELVDLLKSRLTKPTLDNLIDTSSDFVNKTKDAPKKEIVRYTLSTIESYLQEIGKLKAALEEQGIDADVATFNINLKSYSAKDKVQAIQLVLGLALSYDGDASNYNSKQNELKVGSNSTFGFLGAGGQFTFTKEGKIVRRGMMPVSPVSACVTFIGRKTIERSKNYVEEKYPGTVVIYADTDSLFILFPEHIISPDQEGFIKTFKLAKDVSVEISKLFKFPGSCMCIVHEKTAKHLIMYSAKCYALDKYESVTDPGKMEIKGLSFSKRDCCKFVGKMLKEALDCILRKGDKEGAEKLVRERCENLVDGKIPLEDLTIYQKLSKKSYDDDQKVAHAILAQRIDARKPGLGPKSGESVKYLYVNEIEKYDPFQKKMIRVKLHDFENKMPKSEKIEDYEYVVEQNLEVDKYWYLSQQALKNVIRVFEPITDNPSKLVIPSMSRQQRKQLNISSILTKIGKR